MVTIAIIAGLTLLLAGFLLPRHFGSQDWNRDPTDLTPDWHWLGRACLILGLASLLLAVLLVAGAGH